MAPLGRKWVEPLGCKLTLTKKDTVGAMYRSVRSANAECIALFSPKFIESMKTSRHYDMNYVPETKTLSPASEIKVA